jgi:DNA-binding response OmpR family regulator
MKGKILIVDDEKSALNSLSKILKLEGYTVETKEDGQSAVDIISEKSFDLMVLDLQMPGMSGLEVLQEVVKISPDVQIIMLTAHGSLNTAIEALRMGAHDYILKPASTEEILESVAKGISRRSESAKKHRIIEQMENSLRELKDYEGVETVSEVSRMIYTMGENVKIDLERREIWQHDQVVTLTPTEGKLLKVLLENRERVLSHKELVLFVQGYKTTDWEAPEIMRPLVSRLRRKLNQFSDGVEWITNVRGTGYVFDGK